MLGCGSIGLASFISVERGPGGDELNLGEVKRDALGRISRKVVLCRRE